MEKGEQPCGKSASCLVYGFGSLATLKAIWQIIGAKKGTLFIAWRGIWKAKWENGEIHTLKQGMTYVVSDNLSSHRSGTASGVKLLIIDGDFLKMQR